MTWLSWMPLRQSWGQQLLPPLAPPTMMAMLMTIMTMMEPSSSIDDDNSQAVPTNHNVSCHNFSRRPHINSDGRRMLCVHVSHRCSHAMVVCLQRPISCYEQNNQSLLPCRTPPPFPFNIPHPACVM
ncbi:hypothetical protein PTSG_13025 [Salpingoeca rosetta]|uniref:Uncharacterized protein n=1 Tax=Salpingoeca rosetta (strain ATCC 50818 / BSB-021) TaxID=946362 RepID=F2UR05_SALR5|nr:uncharacterized protein PTSG_13025 [Salpingoeca rosetta]EGD80060.1 hypothetical protein PTSG_13025 [Salpingoeca rosetta]|eukprot:XP_004988385.1 hypothetical protein PTSG_13025 [Salpingoeca rosetta]